MTNMLEKIYYYKLTDADDHQIYTCMDYNVIMSMVNSAELSKHEYRLEKTVSMVTSE